MNLDNANKFMKDSSIHVTNINRALKNIKSDVIADFIHIENRRVVIITNKVAGALNLQTIKRYIKNTNDIEANQVKAPRLPQSKSLVFYIFWKLFIYQL